ncbi:brefeldin A-inhibited guanine nucleotide-exchange protein 3 [Patella vulgata]|uniref:brefeldin A-inhibited guanine nucleotide-exchange protein 3 n=1 Tax=Patella vulgata TaxID=6465 RepID=UPI0021809352|nr:brefeldin A-inhibited guanine nucleotide-exchange protein 3 [Patella vulgata]
MEETLKKLAKETSTPKLAFIKQSCTKALEILESPEKLSSTPTHELRERCLEPIQQSLESRSKKLMAHALAGLHDLLNDERFQSSFETAEEQLLPVQVLNTVYITPNLPEEVQVEIMKLLLNMTFSISWCMNAKVICKVSQVYVDTYSGSSQNVRGSVKAAMTQMLKSFTEKLREVEETVVSMLC